MTPLVRASAAEVGVRSSLRPGLQTTLSVWWLDLDSELVFAGDAGTTEASRPSRRAGIEWSNALRVTRWLAVDTDLAYARARFRDVERSGARIPGAIEGAASLGGYVEDLKGFSASLRYRYIGPRPLIEDNSARSESSGLLNGHAAYRVRNGLTVRVDAFNLLDARSSDIDYFYASRLPGEPAGGIEDIHTHPVEPRLFRVSVEVGF